MVEDVYDINPPKLRQKEEKREWKKVDTSFLDRRVSRRTALRMGLEGLAAFVGAPAAVTVLDRLLATNSSKVEAKAGTADISKIGQPVIDRESQIAKAASTASLVSQSIPEVSSNSTSGEVPQGQKETIVSVEELSPLFKNCTEEEKEIAGKMVGKQIDHYKGEYGVDSALKRVLEFKSLVSEGAKELGFVDGSVVPPLLLNLMYVETKGDPFAVSESGAIGLCQLLPEVAAATDTGKAFDIANNPDLLKNPKTNIKCALEYLNELYSYFPDPSLCFWAYHYGMGNLSNAIGIYAREVLGQNVNPTISDSKENKNSTHYLVKNILKDAGKGEGLLNFVKLATSDKVLKGMGIRPDGVDIDDMREKALQEKSKNEGLSTERFPKREVEDITYSAQNALKAEIELEESLYNATLLYVPRMEAASQLFKTV